MKNNQVSYTDYIKRKRMFVISGILILFIAGGNLLIADDIIEGKSIAEWIKQLQDQNRGLQLRAVRALSQVPKELRPKVIPDLLPILKSERENDRFGAAQVLAEYGPDARVAVPHLLPLLEGTQYERNRAAAAVALGRILENSPPSDEVEKVVQALIKLFNDKYSDVRREAVKACGMIGPAAKSCVPHLPARFEDYEWLKDAECFLVRRAAAWTAGRMGKYGECHIDRLIAMMHQYPPVATEFIDAIGEIGPVHENVVPNIVDKLEKTIWGGYQGANHEQLTNYVSHCLAVLAKFGPKSERATDMLLRLLRPEESKRDTERTIKVLEVFEAIGPKIADKAVPVIESSCLNSSEPRVRETAERVIKKLKGESSTK